MAFSEAALAKIYAEYHTTNRRYEALLMAYLALELREPRALEFARQGFCRRLRLMVRCINNVFSILPPERQSVPSDEEVLNTTINI